MSSSRSRAAVSEVEGMRRPEAKVTAKGGMGVGGGGQFFIFFWQDSTLHNRSRTPAQELLQPSGLRHTYTSYTRASKKPRRELAEGYARLSALYVAPTAAREREPGERVSPQCTNTCCKLERPACRRVPLRARTHSIAPHSLVDQDTSGSRRPTSLFRRVGAPAHEMQRWPGAFS